MFEVIHFHEIKFVQISSMKKFLLMNLNQTSNVNKQTFFFASLYFHNEILFICIIIY